jgi:hypothetical protein
MFKGVPSKNAGRGNAYSTTKVLLGREAGFTGTDYIVPAAGILSRSGFAALRRKCACSGFA